MNEVTSAREKAHRSLRTARLALEDDDADGAVSRTYYAAFYIASAALMLVGERPKTHAGVADRFWVRFAETEQIPRDVAKMIHRALNARLKADYDFIGRYDTAAAADLLNDVKVFVDEAEALVDRLEKESEK